MSSPRHAPLVLAVALLDAAFLAPGCAGVRSVTRDVLNTDMVDRQAPPLTGTDWVSPDSATDAAPPNLQGSWALVEFFDPG